MKKTFYVYWRQYVWENEGKLGFLDTKVEDNCDNSFLKEI